MRRQYFALDLKDDPVLIAEYEDWHRAGKIWPDIVASLSASGVKELEIFRCGDRLMMVIEAPDDFSMQSRAALENASARMQAWEKLMWRFQRPLPFAKPNEKWVPMRCVFSLQAPLQARDSYG
jgi:L-rhamnose mutarotase